MPLLWHQIAILIDPEAGKIDLVFTSVSLCVGTASQLLHRFVRPVHLLPQLFPIELNAILIRGQDE